MIERLLIANRGEIACRIIKTCNRLNIKTIAIYSEADKNAKHVKMADEAYYIGQSPALDSYLNMSKILATAQMAKADAIHPGYGFFSENAAFAKACTDNNFIFIGPKWLVIEQMADKAKAKAIMQQAGVPTIPGIETDTQDEKTLVVECKKIGLPVMIKAALGGGGKGMRVVHEENELLHAIQSAKREGQKHFKSDLLLIEKYLPKARHIEVQVFGDNFGNSVHLFERDCSLQRRHQKIIEEAPALNIPENKKAELYAAAIKATKALNYTNAGTVEFLYDSDNSFYFLEINTRLQVEHPVTEMITGLDLVEWQLRVAANEPLPLAQQDIICQGHAIEARVYAEDPHNDFLPATGTLLNIIQPPENATIRFECGIQNNDEITIHYDPMLSKVVAFGETRAKAIHNLKTTLNQYELIGITSNLAFLRRMLTYPDFINAKIHTHTLSQNLPTILKAVLKPNYSLLAPAALAIMLKQAQTRINHQNQDELNSPWNQLSAWQLNSGHIQDIKLNQNDETIHLSIQHLSGMTGKSYFITGPHLKTPVHIRGKLSDDNLRYEIEGKFDTLNIYFQENTLYLFKDGHLEIYQLNHNSEHENLIHETKGKLVAPMPGVVTNIWVKPGAQVKKGDKLIAVEAMKMEHTLWAHEKGTIKTVYYKVGDQVQEGQELVDFEPEA